MSDFDFTFSENIDDYFTITNQPTSINPESYAYLKFNFNPDKMYSTYEGYLTITSSDLFFPEIIIPFSAYTGLHYSWNWISFPFENIQTLEVQDELEPFVENINSNTGWMEYDVSSNTWDYLGLSSIENDICYQVKMSPTSNNYYLNSFGTHVSTSFDLYANQDNWISYWRFDSQDIDNAFGDDFEKLESIKSESWFCIT